MTTHGDKMTSHFNYKNVHNRNYNFHVRRWKNTEIMSRTQGKSAQPWNVLKTLLRTCVFLVHSKCRRNENKFFLGTSSDGTIAWVRNLGGFSWLSDVLGYLHVQLDKSWRHHKTWDKTDPAGSRTLRFQVKRQLFFIVIINFFQSIILIYE